MPNFPAIYVVPFKTLVEPTDKAPLHVKFPLPSIETTLAVPF